MMLRRFLRCERGSPAVEMVLILPLIFPLLFGGLEAANYFWTEHKLIKAVRDGARYASRQSVEDLCPTLSAAVQANVMLLTRTGQLADPDANPKVPGWDDDEQVGVNVSCEAFVNTGIYTSLGGDGPIVTVTAVDVGYPSLMGELGIVDPDIEMNATSHSPVIGI